MEEQQNGQGGNRPDAADGQPARAGGRNTMQTLITVVICVAALGLLFCYQSVLDAWNSASAAAKARAATRAASSKAEAATLAEEAEPPEIVGDAVGIADIWASDVLVEEGHNYDPVNVLDGDMGTCWSMHGTGGSLTLQLDGTYVVTGLQICNGFGLDDIRYYNNDRITGLRLTFADGVVEELALDADQAEQDYAAGQLQEVPFASPHATDSMQVEILSVVAGKKYDDVCIGELYLLGVPGGTLPADVVKESAELVALPGGTTAPASDFVFPYSDSVELTYADLDAAFSGMDSNTARLCSQRAINEIYARYGYHFHPEMSDSAQDAYTYFNSLPWYIALDGGAAWDNTGAVPINGIEAANVLLITQWQQDHSLR